MKKRLSPEVKEKLLEALKTGVEKGYSYYMIWKILRKNGVEISKSTVEHYYYKNFPEKLKKRGPYLPRELRIKLYDEVKKLRGEGLGYRKIKKKIEELYNISLSLSTISR
ncbi:MAG: hypothetical protein QXH49_06200 [Nitrososphaerota archaeon]